MVEANTAGQTWRTPSTAARRRDAPLSQITSP